MRSRSSRVFARGSFGRRFQAVYKKEKEADIPFPSLLKPCERRCPPSAPSLLQPPPFHSLMGTFIGSLFREGEIIVYATKNREHGHRYRESQRETAPC